MDESASAAPTGDPLTLARELVPGLAAIALLDQDPHLTRAAAILKLSQSTVSRQLRRWEVLLSVQLTRSRGRRVELTPAGQVLANSAREALSVLAEGIGTIRGTVRDGPDLTLGSLRSVSTTIVAELIASYFGSYPDVRLQQHEASSTELLESLRTGALDIAVVSPRPSADFGWLHIGEQSLALIVEASHRLASRSSIRLEEVAQERFLALAPQFSTRALADELTREAGFMPTPVLEADDLRMLHELIAQGRGIAILPIDGIPNARVKALPIESLNARREIGIAWLGRRPASVHAALLVDHARDLNARYPGWADLRA